LGSLPGDHEGNKSGNLGKAEIDLSKYKSINTVFDFEDEERGFMREYRHNEQRVVEVR
jgi:hypothetical protein